MPDQLYKIDSPHPPRRDIHEPEDILGSIDPAPAKAKMPHNPTPAHHVPKSIVKPDTPSPDSLIDFQEKEEPVLQDILHDVEKTQPKIKGPTVGSALPSIDQRKKELSVPDTESLKGRDTFQYRKILIFIGIFLFVGAIFASVGLWLYPKILLKFQAVSEDTTDNTGKQENIQKEKQKVEDPSLNKIPSDNVVKEKPDVILNKNIIIDTDLDGLSDKEEALYGTDPNKVDTDGDSLTDRDEAKSFKTDPTNPDTDGDSFYDGDEIKNGYDPKGPGRYKETPK